MNILTAHIGSVAAQYGGGYGWGPGMMGWGWGGHSWFFPVMMGIFWIAVIVGIIFLIRWLAVSTRSTHGRDTGADSAMEILRKRYARGEVNKEEYEDKKKDLMT